MLGFLQQWWGLIAMAIIAVLYAIFNWQGFKKKVVELIFIAEETAREKALQTGQEKFEWVAENGYQFVPLWAKLFVSETAFRKIVQAVFDQIFKWATEQNLG